MKRRPQSSRTKTKQTKKPGEDIPSLQGRRLSQAGNLEKRMDAYWAYPSALKIEDIWSSETLACHRTTGRYKPEIIVSLVTVVRTSIP